LPLIRTGFERPRNRGRFFVVRLAREYSLQDVEQAVLPSAEGAVLVNLPDPARYAFHEILIVAGERTVAFQLKARKGLAQAAHLLAVL